MSEPGPSWYVDLQDDSLERYWNGSRWMNETRSAQPDTPRFREAQRAAARAADPADDELIYRSRVIGLLEAQTAAAERSSTYLAVLAWIVAITTVLGVIVGIVAATS